MKQTSRQTPEKVPVIKMQVEDTDVLSFVAGGYVFAAMPSAWLSIQLTRPSLCYSLTGVKAYVARRIKVRGDLVLAQRLEQLFEKAGGREVIR